MLQIKIQKRKDLLGVESESVPRTEDDGKFNSVALRL